MYVHLNLESVDQRDFLEVKASNIAFAPSCLSSLFSSSSLLPWLSFLLCQKLQSLWAPAFVSHFTSLLIFFLLGLCRPYLSPLFTMLFIDLSSLNFSSRKREKEQLYVVARRRALKCDQVLHQVGKKGGISPLLFWRRERASLIRNTQSSRSLSS